MHPAFSAEKLVVLRKTKGYSQEKLAAAAGINIRTLQRLEKNEVQPQPHTLKILAEALEVPIADLLIEEVTGPARPTVPDTLLALVHFSCLGGMALPLGNLFIPFTIWLYKKQQFPGINDDVKKLLNFQISITLAIFVALILFFAIPDLGWMLIVVKSLAMCMFLFPVISGFNSLKKRPAFYPLLIKFLK